MQRLFRTRPRTDQGLGRWERRQIETAFGRLTVVDEGKGPPILFVHGGILGAGYWREIIGPLSPSYRCIAIDLLGIGESEHLDESRDASYDLGTQIGALGAAFESLSIDEPVVLVVHGWASMVGFSWAAAHQGRVRAVAHMESIVGPLAWPNLPDRLRTHLRLARTSPAALYSMDYFEAAMRNEVREPLSQPVVDAYREVWGSGYTHRQAHIHGLRQIPISGKPSTSQQTVIGYQEWLQQSLIPKLLILGRPGMLVTQEGPAHRMWNQTVVGVVGCHLLAEESPEDITMFLSAWIRQRVLES